MRPIQSSDKQLQQQQKLAKIEWKISNWQESAYFGKPQATNQSIISNAHEIKKNTSCFYKLLDQIILNDFISTIYLAQCERTGSNKRNSSYFTALRLLFFLSKHIFHFQSIYNHMSCCMQNNALNALFSMSIDSCVFFFLL